MNLILTKIQNSESNNFNKSLNFYDNVVILMGKIRNMQTITWAIKITPCSIFEKYLFTYNYV